MPYGIRKVGNSFQVYNKNTGDVKGNFKFPTKKYPSESSAKEGAESQRRLLEGLKSTILNK